jgi:hypothetical protein
MLVTISISHRRFKKDIVTLSDRNGLDAIMKLNPVTFHWKDGIRGTGEQLGFIAQDVQNVLPQLVSEDKDGTLTLNSSGFVPPVVKAIQEQQAKIDDLQKRIEMLEAKIK